MNHGFPGKRMRAGLHEAVTKYCGQDKQFSSSHRILVKIILIYNNVKLNPYIITEWPI